VECGVQYIDLINRARSSFFDNARELTRKPGTSYSPGDFLRRFAAVIAICLGLALMAHISVTVAGAN
jgi:hypothetical protein